MYVLYSKISSVCYSLENPRSKDQRKLVIQHNYSSFSFKTYSFKRNSNRIHKLKIILRLKHFYMLLLGDSVTELTINHLINNNNI